MALVSLACLPCVRRLFASRAAGMVWQVVTCSFGDSALFLALCRQVFTSIFFRFDLQLPISGLFSTSWSISLATGLQQLQQSLPVAALLPQPMLAYSLVPLSSPGYPLFGCSDRYFPQAHRALSASCSLRLLPYSPIPSSSSSCHSSMPSSF